MKLVKDSVATSSRQKRNVRKRSLEHTATSPAKSGLASPAKSVKTADAEKKEGSTSSAVSVFVCMYSIHVHTVMYVCCGSILLYNMYTIHVHVHVVKILLFLMCVRMSVRCGG